MAEPVSLTFSLLALGKTAAQTAKGLFNLGRTVSDAKTRINQLATEVNLFAVLPQTFASLLKEDDSPFRPQLLEDTDAQLRDCQSILDDIRREMNGIDPKSLSMVSRAKWYFREETVQLLRGRLEAAKTSLTLRVVILNLAVSLKSRRDSVSRHYGEAAQVFESDTAASDRTAAWVSAGHGNARTSSIDSGSRTVSSIGGSTWRNGSNSSAMHAPEAVRFLLAAWTNVKDTSILPGDASRATDASPSANEPRGFLPRVHVGATRDPRRLSPNSRPTPHDRPWEESITASFSRYSDSQPHFNSQFPPQQAGIEIDTIRVEYLGGREGPSVPVACMPLLSWQNSDHFWIQQFSCQQLLNFSIRYKSFFHYLAIPYHAARSWQDQRTLSGKVLGVHTLIRKVSYRLAEGYQQLIEHRDHHADRGKTAALANQIEDARKVTARIQDGRFGMHRCKRSEAGSCAKGPNSQRRVEPWDWDAEIARGGLNPSRCYIAIDFPDEDLGRSWNAQGSGKPAPPGHCRAHHHGRRVRARHQSGWCGFADLEPAYVRMSDWC